MRIAFSSREIREQYVTCMKFQTKLNLAILREHALFHQYQDIRVLVYGFMAHDVSHNHPALP
jgi:hypothetical protein